MNKAFSPTEQKLTGYFFFRWQ